MSVIQAIPASQLVDVTPGVVSAGGNAKALNMMVLTTSSRVPIGQVASFPTQLTVAAFFGANSPEATIAATYFAGFQNSTIKPGNILFAQYAWGGPVPAYLQSGPVSSLTLAQLQAISGTIIVEIDGTTFTSGSFNLASATSFSSAAALIQTALAAIEAAITGTLTPAIGVTDSATTIALNVMTVAAVASGKIVPGAVVTGTGVAAGTEVVAQLTGPAGGAGTYQVSISQSTSAFVATCTNAAQALLNATAIGSGTLAVGQNLQGASVAAGSMIVGELTGSGGTGYYIVTPSQSVSSEAMNAGVAEITFDSVSGSFFITGGNSGANGSIGYASGTAAAALNLTQANGAILSQGSAQSTPTGFMNALLQRTTNFFSFMTTFIPVTADMVSFGQWSNAQGPGYFYLMPDSNIALTTNSYGSTAWGILQAANVIGVCPIYDPTLATDDNIYAAGAGAWAASLNFNQTKGRQSLAYSVIPGLTPNVVSGEISAQLEANGVNFYGTYSNANNDFTWWQDGFASGAFKWADTYAQAVYFASQLQLAALNLLGSVGNIPYNLAGASLIESALSDPINQAVNFGTIESGVTLSAEQIADINNQAGIPIDQTIFARGWYLQVGIATAQVRAARQSPPITLWYTDGQSVQKINIASLVIE